MFDYFWCGFMLQSFASLQIMGNCRCIASSGSMGCVCARPTGLGYERGVHANQVDWHRPHTLVALHPRAIIDWIAAGQLLAASRELLCILRKGQPEAWGPAAFSPAPFPVTLSQSRFRIADTAPEGRIIKDEPRVSGSVLLSPLPWSTSTGPRLASLS